MLLAAALHYGCNSAVALNLMSACVPIALRAQGRDQPWCEDGSGTGKRFKDREIRVLLS
jgi:hypothetical protein